MKFSVCHASRKHHQFEGVADLILPHKIFQVCVQVELNNQPLNS